MDAVVDVALWNRNPRTRRRPSITGLPVNSDFESRYNCDLTALDPFQRTRHSELSAEVWRRKLETKALANGYEFRFPFDPSLFQKIAELTILEHLCCPFLEIGLMLDKSGGPIWVRLTGERGVKSFLRAELGIND